MAIRSLKMSVTFQANIRAVGTIVFLHGSGDTGVGIQEWIKLEFGKVLSFPHLRIIYPTAPVRRYTPNNGNLQNVWFDRQKIAQHVAEDLPTIEDTATSLEKILEEEKKLGIDPSHVIFGGFSMGASMSLQMAYRFKPNLAGVFCLSSFLNVNSKVYEILEENPLRRRAPLFMCHGQRDDLALHSWGESTFKELESRGVKGEFHSLPNVYHELNRRELNMLYDWICKIIPETDET